MTTLRDEIKQTKPFQSLEEEADLSLFRTVQLLSEANARLLRQHGLTFTQYNVLRILRGAGSTGLGRNDIRDRLLDRSPDATRLLDKMEEAGLVRRERSRTDRRCVPTVLTEKGRLLVDELDAPVAAMHHEQFGHLTTGQLHTLIETLAQIRSHIATD